ncbi:MAG: hypothetical protein GY909_09920 [Oligoflexia bacterium]|nr:hypothetical protein [Oligoflexia bacterium]
MNNVRLSVLSLLVFLLSFSPVTYAQGENDSFGNTVKEIFIKGSIDDNKLFLVLGLEKGTQRFTENLKDAVDLDHLKDIGQDIAQTARETGRGIYNGGNDDLIEAIGDGAEFAIERGKDVVAAPFRSLKKIPGAFKVSMEQAREAYYEEENRMGANLKYAGHAIWASTKVGYYLVIEAPVVAVANLAAAIVATPVAAGVKLASIGLNILIDGTGTLLNLGYYAVKGLANGLVAFTNMAYSLVSTTVAVTATTVAAGMVAVFAGTKWILTKPLALFNPARSKVKTNISGEELDAVVESITKQAGESQAMLDLGINTAFYEVKGNSISKKITLYNNSFGRTKKAMTVKVSISQGKIKITSVMKMKHSKRLYKDSDSKDDISKRSFRKELGAKMQALFSTL